MCIYICIYIYTYIYRERDSGKHTFTKKYSCTQCSVVSNSVWPMDCNLPGSSVCGILQARILEWVAISFSRESSQPRYWTCVSCIGRQILYHWATWEAHLKHKGCPKDSCLNLSVLQQVLSGFLPEPGTHRWSLAAFWSCEVCGEDKQ